MKDLANELSKEEKRFEKDVEKEGKIIIRRIDKEEKNLKNEDLKIQKALSQILMNQAKMSKMLQNLAQKSQKNSDNSSSYNPSSQDYSGYEDANDEDEYLIN